MAAHLDRLAAAGVAGVKVFVEPGFGPGATWPIIAPAVREAIVRGAAERSLRALRKISWTVKDGVAHTPHEWLHDPS